jgi:hypothetical protein
MNKCSYHRPDFKELVFIENPTRKNVFNLQTSSAPFTKFNYFRLEEPIKPELIRLGVKYVCDCWIDGCKVLHTGIIPTGAPGYYFGDHLETVKDKRKSSLMIFRLLPDTSAIQIYYFNHFNKRSIPMKIEFCRNFIRQL